MRIGDFNFNPGLVPSIVFLLLFPLLVSLGTWQLNRAEQKHQLMQQRQGRKNSEAVDLNRVSALTLADRHKPAQATGRYLPRPQWLLDNRLYQGRPGYHVFSLLQLDDESERKLLVNRGWVTMGENRKFLPELPLPPGQHSLRGRLDSPASVGLVLEQSQLSNLAPLSVVQNLDLAELSVVLGESLPAYALVLDEGQAGVLQRDWRPARLITPEKHVGYAMQWFALAFALLIIFVGVNTRRVKDEEEGDHDR